MAKKSRATKRAKKKLARREPVAKKVSGKKATSRKKAAKPSPPATPLQAHFEKAGVLFGQTTSKILRKLASLMGTERCEKWKTFSYHRHHGLETSGNEYSFFQRAVELNTLFSLQSRVTLRVCEWLCSQVDPLALNGKRIGDLGCGGGVLTGWLALQHPQCRVVGFDSLPHVLAAAAETQKSPNLRFMQWDYHDDVLRSDDKCDVLVSCFGVDFPPWRKHTHPLSGDTLRTGEFYETRKKLMRAFFGSWRSAIVDGGKLFCVLRIPWDIDFLAVQDAAHEQGWTFEAEQSGKLSVGSEAFPAMTFTAHTSPPLAEEEVLWHWVGGKRAATAQEELVGTEAFCVYRSLPDKTILKEASHAWDDDVAFHAVVGTSHSQGFQFTRATSGYARFGYCSDVEKADPWFPPEELSFDWDGVF